MKNKHTYILQYCGYSGENRGIREFINGYLKNNSLLFTCCGRGLGGGITFSTTIDINELHRVLQTYELEYVLYQLDTGSSCMKTNEEKVAILTHMFQNVKEGKIN